MRFIKKLFILMIVIAVIFSGIVGVSIYRQVYQKQTAADIEVVIPKGSSMGVVAELLAREGVIKSPRTFTMYGRFRRAGSKLHAGIYDFPAGLTMADVLTMIVKGEVKRYRFTIPEGFSVRDIAQLLALMEEFGPIVAAQFIKFAQDPQFVDEMGVGGRTSLEGYLFPDTYVVYNPQDVREIIRPMVQRFKEVYDDDLKLRAKELGMTNHEVITLASIIEKETGKPEERPLIASVFHNRLKKGMVLATDPTVIYGIADFDGNLRRKDLETPGPYNTYLNAGLPPGPIASPGEKAIRAALYPKTTNYYFFVSKNDGSHHFSKTMGEHGRAVQHFQIRRSDEPFE